MLRFIPFFKNSILVSVGLLLSSQLNAKEWHVSLVPASLEKDNTVRLVAGSTNGLTLYLQADRATLAKSKEQKLTLEFDLPPGFHISETGGYYQFSKIAENLLDSGRMSLSYEVRAQNKHLIGTIGSRLNSEWQCHALFLSVPDSIRDTESFIQVQLTQNEHTQQFTWPLRLYQFPAPKQRPKLTTIGLWDYNYSRASIQESATGMAEFFYKSGVNFLQSAPQVIYRQALRDKGILSGGNTHHAHFYDKNHPDYLPDGKKITSNFSDAASISRLPDGAEIAGVAQLVENAKRSGGIASFDYEPRGVDGGFSPQSVALFCKQYKLSDAEFEQFRLHLEKSGTKSFQTQDPKLADLWKKWTAFRSAQVSGYTRRIYQAFKQGYPEGILLNTTMRSYGTNTPSTQALGANNAAMAPYADIIAPQLYFGYGAAQTKLVMQYTEGWRAEMDHSQAKSRLWPLLLVRYAGAGNKNSPPRVRQQIIGTLAHGANGIVLYYPGLMDAPYWEMLARTTEEVAEFEEFYQKGKRLSQKVSIINENTPPFTETIWPGYEEKIMNPTYAYTVHQLGDKKLFTFFNMDEEKSRIFELPLNQVLQQKNLKIEENRKISVSPMEIGFLITTP